MSDNPALELATKYAKFMDDKSFQQLQEIMADDVVIAGPEFECIGLVAFSEQCKSGLGSFSHTMHMIGNQSGQWSGADYSGETYCVATHIYEKDGIARKWELGIRYDDSISLIDGDYKYTRRYLNIVWDSDTPLQS